MYSTVFERFLFLQSIGWAIINSFWQAGMLYLFYYCLSLNEKQSPTIKHHASLILLMCSGIWFFYSIVQNYRSLISASGDPSTGMFMVKSPLVYDLIPVLTSFYLLVLFYSLFFFIKKYYENYFLQTNGLTKAPVHIRLFSTRISFHLGIKKKVQVWISMNVDVPCITGFIKPIILLPAAVINNLSPLQVESILVHELAHIKRNDYLVNFLQSVLELILWFNPFAILLSRAAKKEREHCCDDWVMNFEYDKYEYAEALLVLEEQRQSRSFFAIGATNNKKLLLKRVKRLFINTPASGFTGLQNFGLLACIVLATCLIVGMPAAVNSTSQKELLVGDDKNNTGTNFSKLSLNEIASSFSSPKPQHKRINIGDPVIVKGKDMSKKNKISPETNRGQEFVEAYINEDLITTPELVVAPGSLVSERGDSSNRLKYFVKVEEQESGKKQKNTYYLEVTRENGNIAVKPLVIYNKYTSPKKKITPKKLPTPTTSSLTRKRITS